MEQTTHYPDSVHRWLDAPLGAALVQQEAFGVGLGVGGRRDVDRTADHCDRVGETSGGRQRGGVRVQRDVVRLAAG